MIASLDQLWDGPDPLLIVAKLEWAKLGDSERQLRDAKEILAVSR